MNEGPKKFLEKNNEERAIINLTDEVVDEDVDDGLRVCRYEVERSRQLERLG